ncbi:MAG: sensor histidine kinase [Hyphomicrobiaceae bacterium]
MDQKVDITKSPVQVPAIDALPQAAMPVLPRSVSLSTKLLLLTGLFVMLAEVLIFVPSVANFRLNWLNDRLTAAQLASLAAEASPNGDVPQMLRNELLRTAQVKAVALKRNDQRQLILNADMPVAIDASFDLSMPGGSTSGLIGRLDAIWDAIDVLFGSGKRTFRIVGRPSSGAGDIIEIVLPEAPLKAAMLGFGLNIMMLSIIISVITAALVYLSLNTLLVRPIMRIADNMLHFSNQPEDASRIIVPTGRGDEIGTAERELSHMQTELSLLLHQKSRLAALGLAVSKINHDLRNMLASAQLLSDRLAYSEDPTVQRFAPKLIASLDRAIAFCNDTLRFGRAEEAAPRRDQMLLMPLVTEVADNLGLPREDIIAWRADMDAALRVDADRDQLYRVLSNLTRNAIQAIESGGADAKGNISIIARRTDRDVRITISDDGPGFPPRARAHLFQAFQGSTRRGGTGLGLAIAFELIAAHGGAMRLLDTPQGATFEIVIPDRAA